MTQIVTPPQFRVFRQLDQGRLSSEFIEKIGEAEGNTEWVDADRARDFAWTEEIMGATIGAALVDQNGQFVQRFPGPNGFKQAEKARQSVRVVFDYQTDEEEESDSDLPAGFEGIEDPS